MNDDLIEELREIFEAVMNLESEVYEKTGGCEYLNFQVVSNGFHTRIEFLGILLWDTENECREFDEVNNCYEPMEPFLRRVLNKEMSKLNKLNFIK